MVNRSKIAGWGVGVGILIGLAIGFLVFHHPHDRKPPWFTSHELSEDEKAQVKAIAVETFKKDEAAIRELENRTDDLKKHLQDSSTSDEQLRSEFAKINEMRAYFADHRFNLDLKVRKIVGPARIGIFDPLGPPFAPPPRPKQGTGDDDHRDHQDQVGGDEQPPRPGVDLSKDHAVEANGARASHDGR